MIKIPCPTSSHDTEKVAIKVQFNFVFSHFMPLKIHTKFKQWLLHVHFNVCTRWVIMLILTCLQSEKK